MTGIVAHHAIRLNSASGKSEQEKTPRRGGNAKREERAFRGSETELLQIMDEEDTDDYLCVPKDSVYSVLPLESARSITEKRIASLAKA